MGVDQWRDEVVTRLKEVKYPGFSRDIVHIGVEFFGFRAKGTTNFFFRCICIYS